MATATKQEVTILTLTQEESSYLRGYLVNAKGIAAKIRDALARAQAPF